MEEGSIKRQIVVRIVVRIVVITVVMERIAGKDWTRNIGNIVEIALLLILVEISEGGQKSLWEHQSGVSKSMFFLCASNTRVIK